MVKKGNNIYNCLTLFFYFSFFYFIKDSRQHKQETFKQMEEKCTEIKREVIAYKKN